MPTVSIQATLNGVPKGVAVIPRSQVKYNERYHVQLRHTRKDGKEQWLPQMETDDWNKAVEYLSFAKRKKDFRIVDNSEQLASP